MRCVLVSCCGIPASGKTTFCRGVIISAASYDPHGRSQSKPCLKRSSTDAAMATMISRVQTPIRVSHVCFDEHIDLARRRRNSRSRLPVEGGGYAHDVVAGEGRESDGQENAGSEGSVRGTGSAGKVYNDVPREKDHSYAVESREGGAECWHEGRRKAMAEVEALAAGTRVAEPSSVYISGEAGVDTPSCPGIEANRDQSEEIGCDASLHVVLADDNMHFRSMRHDVLRLARKYGCGYVQVYFPTEVEVAFRRNAARVNTVPKAVIRKMAASIQPPDPQLCKWERYTMIVETPTYHEQSDGDVSGFVANTHVEADTPLACHFGDNSAGNSVAVTFSLFWQIVARAAEDPVPSLLSVSLSSAPEQEEARKATRVSILHQLDLELREAVNRIADKASKASLTRGTFRAVMDACTAARRTSMRSARRTKEDENDARNTHTATEISRIQNDLTEGSRGQDSTLENCDEKPTTHARSPRGIFASEFAQGIGVVDGLGASNRVALVDAAKGFGTLNPGEA